MLKISPLRAAFVPATNENRYTRVRGTKQQSEYADERQKHKNECGFQLDS